MQKLKIVILPYRDHFFLEKYGYAVRDLQILKCLESLDCVESISFINRPISIIELLLLKKRYKSTFKAGKVEYIHSVSTDLFGPLKERLWTVTCYNKILKKTIERLVACNSSGHKLVFLDFHPLADVTGHDFEGWFYWYDLIDNFTKHNRFSKKEKRAVSYKYNSLSKCDVVTSVNPNAFINVNCSNKVTLSNGIFRNNEVIVNRKIISPDVKFTFGFIGFITNKFDVDFLFSLLEFDTSYTAVIYGEFYDASVKQRLSSHSRIVLKGSFKSDEIRLICSSFEIGLIPYIRELCHDESPLKLYNYLDNSTPCISTVVYELSERVVFYTSNESKMRLKEFINWALILSAKEKANLCVEACKDNYYLDYKVRSFLDNYIK